MSDIQYRRARWRGRWRGLGSALVVAAIFALASPASAVDPTYNEEQLKAKKEKAEAELKKTAEVKRPWFFDAIFTWSFKLINDTAADDYEGTSDGKGEQTGLNDLYETLYLRANYDLPALGPLPPLGRVSFRISGTVRHLVQEGRNGFYFGDMRLYFSRPFAFNVMDQDFGGRVYFYWTFPTHEQSIREANISRPTLIVALSKKLPYGFVAFFRPFVRLNWHRYAEKTSLEECKTWDKMEIPGYGNIGPTTNCGGQANDKWLIGYELQALYNLWLHKPVTLGFTFGQYGISKYAVSDGESQPWNHAFYWDLFAGYDTSKWTNPVSTSVYLSLAHSRAAVFEGDGVPRYDVFDRNHTEMVLSISAKY